MQQKRTVRLYAKPRTRVYYRNLAIELPDFYRLPLNEGRLTLVKDAWEVPRSYPFGAEELVPLRAGEHIRWRVAKQA